MNDLTLKELRKQYLRIKSTSKKGFIDILNEQRAKDNWQASEDFNKKQSEGLGDTIDKLTTATGIKKAIEWLANGRDCGCEERKKKLNEKYRYKAECMVKSEYDFWKDYLKRHNEKRFSKEDVFRIAQMHRRIFKVRTEICSNCNSGAKVLNRMVKELTNVYNVYKN